jgi:hypothetical protein
LFERGERMPPQALPVGTTFLLPRIAIESLDEF